MRKERIKSVILVLLILNCLQLTGQIWFNKKLWPTGYNFFNSVSNNPLIGAILENLSYESGGAHNHELYANAVRPQKIVISSGNAREVYRPSQKQYDDAYEIVENVIAKLLETSNPRSAVITSDEWHSYLKGKSVYIDYGFGMDMNNLANSFSHTVGASFPGEGSVSDIMITGDAVTKESIVCMFDPNSGIVTKYWIDYAGDKLLKYIESTTFGRHQNKAFAFELNLDRPPGDFGIERKILLGSLVLLPMESENRKEIEVLNTLKNDSIVFDKIVLALGYTPSSLRKSVNQNGTASYVENSATIRINPNGLVEYNAVEAEKGILLQSGKAELYNIVSRIAEIANNVYVATDEEQVPDIQLVSDLIESKDGNYTAKFNYSFNGIPVITQLDSEESVFNAITAHVQNGYLKSFKILLRKFEETDREQPVMQVISAIDSLAVKFSSTRGEVLVDDIFECYSSESDVNSVVWGVKVSGMNNTVIVTE